MANNKNKQDTAQQNKAWQVRIAIVERQSLILRCQATLDAAAVAKESITFDGYQVLADRETLATVAKAKATKEIVQLIAHLAAI